jgi:hypothetical protein
VRETAIKGAAGFIRVGSGKCIKVEGPERTWLNLAEVQPQRGKRGPAPPEGADDEVVPPPVPFK